TSRWQDIEEGTGTSTSMDKQYVWGIRYVDELICRDDATPQRLYAVQDANFDLTAICDTSANVKERYLFDPYGNRTIMHASWTIISSSAYAWSIGHQGLMHDTESGLIYNRNRMIHPFIGGFIVRDPIFYSDGTNLYEYTHSSPIILTDPTGTCKDCRCPGGVLAKPQQAVSNTKTNQFLSDVASLVSGPYGAGTVATLFSAATSGYNHFDHSVNYVVLITNCESDPNGGPPKPGTKVLGAFTWTCDPKGKPADNHTVGFTDISTSDYMTSMT